MSILLAILGAILGFNVIVIAVLMTMYVQETRRHAHDATGDHAAAPRTRRRVAAAHARA